MFLICKCELTHNNQKFNVICCIYTVASISKQTVFMGSNATVKYECTF